MWYVIAEQSDRVSTKARREACNIEITARFTPLATRRPPAQRVGSFLRSVAWTNLIMARLKIGFENLYVTIRMLENMQLINKQTNLI